MRAVIKTKGMKRHFQLLSSRKCLLSIMAMLAMLPSVLHADDACTETVTTNGFVGKNNGNETYTFSELESIDQIVGIELQNGYWVYCSSDSYVTNANILTVKNSRFDLYKCKAKFTVKGQKKNCTANEDQDNDIAQVPLFLAQSATPNIMYILDDSGSMQFELMPEQNILGDARYVYPRADGIYGGSDYSNYVVTVDDNNGFNARSRSPQINTVYYNPSVTYEPWIKGDGSYYPDADIDCAPHNPSNDSGYNSESNCRDLTEDNDRYNSNYWVSCNKSGSCSYSQWNKTFWPATYFWYDGTGDNWSWSNYSKVEIRPGNTYSGHGRENRDDCADAANGTCSYNEEIQNFANWYSYYRSRVATARGGSGRAFSEQGANLRVGFGSLNSSSRNIDGENTSVILRGVREFSGENRNDFFEELYELDIPAAGTPLRRALNASGEYFERSDNKGPWSETPGEDGGEQLECRRNYTVLMTDGYWSGSSPGGDPSNNNDGSDNPSHTSTGGASYTYKAVSPFEDSRSDTLADVAMYYWKNDLRSDMPNAVTVNKKNPAFWQHMVTFGVGLGVSGTVDPDTAFAAIASGADISWPSPTSNELHKIDDLLHAAVNSRGQFFSATDPDSFAKGLSDALQVIANESKSSASAVAANSTRLDSGTLVYQASFNSLEWTGRIVAYKVKEDGSLGDIKWDSDSASIASPSTRNLFAAVAAPGAASTSAVAFTTSNWSSLDAAQRSALNNGGNNAAGQNLLNWLRGESSVSSFRSRSSLLGDIVNSDPVFVGNRDDYGFHTLSGTEGSSYRDYLRSKKAWASIIVVGANDGMLHGFNAETGKELFGFLPSSIFNRLPLLADPNYEHRYFVDGSPRASDAYINGNWTTVAVGATGAGGRSVFAVDVSNPATISQNNFLWEFATPSDASDKLGVAMSEPTIIRVAAGNKWVAIFGNGYESGDTVKLMVVDLATGSLIKAIDTEVSGEGNGLGSPVPVDIDNDRITDYVYAGDLKGNLWKFDLTGSNTNSWDVAFKSGGDPAPLFSAVDGDGDPQPITMRPTVGRHPAGGYFVYFGTGKYFETVDATVGNDPQLQDFYGIRDNGAVVDRDDLLVQDVFYEAVGTNRDGSSTEASVRLVSSNGGTAPDYGWRLPLQPPNNSLEGERSVSRPLLRNGRIIFTSLIPTDNICGFGGRSWLMELDAYTGGRYADPVLDTNNDGLVNELDAVLYIDGEYYPISGRGSDEIIKTPGVISKGSLEYKYTSGSSGTVGVITEKGDDGGDIGRQSWRQLQ